MNTLPVLIRREVQEHRGLVIYTPLGLVVFLVAMMLFSFAFSGSSSSVSYTMTKDGMQSDHRMEVFAPLSSEGLHRFAELPEQKREAWLGKSIVAISVPFLILLWTVTFSYLIGTLYGERRDRSILFWKSMPVSDAMTVTSKLLMAVVVLPVIYFVAIVVAQLIMMLIATVAALVHSVDPWHVLWGQSHLVAHWGALSGWLALNAIWYLPACAWLMLVSSWARTAPWAWALAVPVGLVILEKILLPFTWISHWISLYSWPLGMPYRVEFHPAMCLPLMFNVQMVVSLAIAAAMIYGAIYMRGRTDEI
ncbi:MAG TPA: hypothetical protein VJ998_12955 [Pseudomonadales bacterium]|nr:hypothetical protein [Pseudomonadales bacterium]